MPMWTLLAIPWLLVLVSYDSPLQSFRQEVCAETKLARKFRVGSLPLWLQAGLWGWLSGSALLIGAAVGYLASLPQRVIAAIMALGAGVLISALSLDLMLEAYHRGGMDSTAYGFLSGAAVYTAANWYLSRKGAKHRKRSGTQQPTESQQGGSGLAIAAGALLDGIPESIVIGISLLEGGAVSFIAVVAIFLSNLPEGLSSSAGMKRAGRSKAYIFGVWAGIALISGGASICGYTLFQSSSPDTIAAITAVAAGAILAMLADTMIPEAFEQAHSLSGFATVIGFLAAFYLAQIAGHGRQQLPASHAQQAGEVGKPQRPTGR